MHVFLLDILQDSGESVIRTPPTVSQYAIPHDRFDANEALKSFKSWIAKNKQNYHFDHGAALTK